MSRHGSDDGDDTPTTSTTTTTTTTPPAPEASDDNDNNDTQAAGAGDDTLAGADNDTAAGMTLTGTAGDDHLSGGEGDDSISGGDGNDVLRGGEGHDTLDGGAGNDTLISNHGPDVLTGGAGNDLFVIQGHVPHTADGLTQITDFTSGEDKLKFHDEGHNGGVTNDTFATGTATDYAAALADAQAKIAGGDVVVAEQVGNDLIVFAGGEHNHHVEDAVMLVGKSLSDLSPSDII